MSTIEVNSVSIIPTKIEIEKPLSFCHHSLVSRVIKINLVPTPSNSLTFVLLCAFFFTIHFFTIIVFLLYVFLALLISFCSDVLKTISPKKRYFHFFLFMF